MGGSTVPSNADFTPTHAEVMQVPVQEEGVGNTQGQERGQETAQELSETGQTDQEQRGIAQGRSEQTGLTDQRERYLSNKIDTKENQPKRGKAARSRAASKVAAT